MDSELSKYDKKFGFQNDYLSTHSPRRIAKNYLFSLFSKRSFRELLESDWRDYNTDKYN